MTDRQVALERLVADAPDSPILHVVNAWAAFPRRLWGLPDVRIAVAAPLNFPLRLGEEAVYQHPRIEVFRAMRAWVEEEPAWLYAVDETSFERAARFATGVFVRTRVL